LSCYAVRRGELHGLVVFSSIQWVKKNMECMWKVYEQLVGSFRALDGRNVRRRHGRAVTMGCRSGEPSSGCFWLGKSGWLGSWRRSGAHPSVGWGLVVLVHPVAVVTPCRGWGCRRLSLSLGKRRKRRARRVPGERVVAQH
jgi:hypothetical protein